MGFTSWDEMIQFCVDYPDYKLLLDQIHERVREDALQRAIKNNGAGNIFHLKNLGMSDKSEVKIDPITIKIEGIDSKF